MGQVCPGLKRLRPACLPLCGGSSFICFHEEVRTDTVTPPEEEGPVICWSQNHPGSGLARPSEPAAQRKDGHENMTRAASGQLGKKIRFYIY